MMKEDTMSILDIYLISETLYSSPFMQLTFVTSGKKAWQARRMGAEIFLSFQLFDEDCTKLNHMPQYPTLVSSGGKKKAGRKANL